MCVATDPLVLLLDEPLAGMGAEESEQMLVLLSGLRENHAILLVEHDMDAVFRIADRITVLVNGAVITSDVPQAVRDNRDVQTAAHHGVRRRQRRPGALAVELVKLMSSIQRPGPKLPNAKGRSKAWAAP